MKKFVIGLAVLPFLAGVSLAGQPQALTDQQMDKVSAGFDFFEMDVNNVGTTVVAADLPNVFGTTENPSATCPTGVCFVAVSGTTYPSHVQSLQVYAIFGPLQ